MKTKQEVYWERPNSSIFLKLIFYVNAVIDQSGWTDFNQN